MAQIRRFALVALLLTIAVPAQIPKTTCGASGVVLDEGGQPVPGATVFLAGTVALNGRTQADSEGRFLLKGFSPGDWGFMAYKESAGYPYNFAAFFSNPGEQFPTIHVAPGALAENVVIRLGIKAATLVFELSDEAGEPVNAPASAIFNRPDMPEVGEYNAGNIASKEKLLVPAVPLRLTVEAEGYEPWHYGGEEWKTDKGQILPSSERTVAVTVRLRQAEKPDARNH